jgi:hypothetical protein
MAAKLYAQLALIKSRRQGTIQPDNSKSSDQSWIRYLAYSFYCLYQYSSAYLPFIETFHLALTKIQETVKIENSIASMLLEFDVPEDYLIHYLNN